jgi:hypothetical protein
MLIRATMSSNGVLAVLVHNVRRKFQLLQEEPDTATIKMRFFSTKRKVSQVRCTANVLQFLVVRAASRTGSKLTGNSVTCYASMYYQPTLQITSPLRCYSSTFTR